jgi:GNAT superfamily N-acetyltransferase
VGDGCEPGLLAYTDGESVGWASVAPRNEFHAIVSSPQYGPRDDERDVWSIVCFVVDKPHRRSGVAGVLLDAAVVHAFAHGAAAVEAYPHVSNGSDYMGSLALFERAGFATVRDANKRAIVRRER